MKAFAKALAPRIAYLVVGSILAIAGVETDHQFVTQLEAVVTALLIVGLETVFQITRKVR
jgi:hypothetical protein